MPLKKTKTTGPLATAAVDGNALLRNADFKAACDVAMQELLRGGAAEVRCVELRAAIAEGLRGLLRTQEYPAARKVVARLGQPPLAQHFNAEQLAEWNARSGVWPDDGAPAALIAHALDAVVAQQDAALAPLSHRPAVQAVLDGFAHYHAKRDDAARDALQAIGLTSPLLEWKLLLRGLLALSAPEPVRALESFTKLNIHRLTGELARALVLQLDPKDAGLRDEMGRQAAMQQRDALQQSTLVGQLKALQAAHARKAKMKPLLAMVKILLPEFERHAAEWRPRLKHWLYAGMVRTGDFDDVQRFAKLLGPMPDDPNMDWLQAVVFGELRRTSEAIRFAEKYTAWLDEQSNWPAPVARRARAIVANMAASVAEDAAQSQFPEDISGLLMMMQGRTINPADAELHRKQAADGYLRAIELAPDWSAPLLSLMDILGANCTPAQASAIASAARTHHRDDVPVQLAHAAFCLRRKDYFESLSALRQVARINPLFPQLDRLLASAILPSAIQRLGVEPLAEVLRDFQADERYCLAAEPVLTLGLLMHLYAGNGQPTEAKATHLRLQAIPHTPLAEALLAQGVGALLKQKPALKKVDTQAASARLAEATHANDFTNALHVWDLFHIAGRSYTGHKTWEKKLYTRMVEVIHAPPDHATLQDLVVLLYDRSYSTPAHRTLLKVLVREHPQSAILAAVEFLTTLNAKRCYTGSAAALRRHVARLNASVHPVAPRLRAEIDKVLTELLNGD